MITHYIITSSSYSQGTRIALDYIISKESDYTKFKSVVEKIVRKCGQDVSITTHFIQTVSESWKSVYEKDYFFKDVKLIKSLDEFIELVQKDRVLTGLDVGKYILHHLVCSYIELEDIVYRCYKDYLKTYKKPLYKETTYKLDGKSTLIPSIHEEFKNLYMFKKIDKTKESYLPAKSRILFAENGLEKLKSIDETLLKYKEKSCYEESIYQRIANNLYEDVKVDIKNLEGITSFTLVKKYKIGYNTARIIIDKLLEDKLIIEEHGIYLIKKEF